MARPWTAYALRVFCCGLLFVSARLLLGGSTFALRMRNDAPVTAIVFVLAAGLSFLPLAFPKRFLSAFLVSAAIVSGLGAYWWTTIPWDELIKDSGFPTPGSPDILDYALVASPAVLAAFYAAVSRPSVLRADLKERGADADEIGQAVSASFLSAAALLVVCGALAFGLIVLMASGIPFDVTRPMPVGLPALVIVAALVTVAYALLARRLPRPWARSRREPPGSHAASARAPSSRRGRGASNRVPE